jgi:hypothetical protein
MPDVQIHVSVNINTYMYMYFCKVHVHFIKQQPAIQRDEKEIAFAL